jgi:predicted small integral membrane protein
MSKVKDFVLRIYNVCKDWVIANGIEGIVGLLLGLLLWSLGQKVFAGVSFGVFFTRNWDILKGWILGKLK